MRARFSFGCCTVVAADAGARNLTVVYRRNRQPATGGMAGFAVVSGRNVAVGFTCGCYAIVAAGADAKHFIMVDFRNRNPC